MSGEIKFRFWSEIIKSMSPPTTLEELAGDHIVPIIFDGMIPMQYSGLYDRKGIEGCAGDIIWCYPGMSLGQKFLGQIIYKDGGFQFKSTIADQTFYLGDAQWFDIIGNIYENPELVK